MWAQQAAEFIDTLNRVNFDAKFSALNATFPADGATMPVDHLISSVHCQRRACAFVRRAA
jgi:hypothetical protein